MSGDPPEPTTRQHVRTILEQLLKRQRDKRARDQPSPLPSGGNTVEVEREQDGAAPVRNRDRPA